MKNLCIHQRVAVNCTVKLAELPERPVTQRICLNKFTNAGLQIQAMWFTEFPTVSKSIQ